MTDLPIVSKPFWSRWYVQFALLAFGILIAIFLDRSLIVRSLSGYSVVGQVLAAFILGTMYASLLTVTPSTVGIIQLAQAGAPAWLIGLAGGVGAMVGDLTIFAIFKVGFIDRILAHFRKEPDKTISLLFSIRLFRAVLILLGAIIIATPIPDEVGLALMGLSKVRWQVVAALGLVFNGLGIATIALLAQ